MPTHHRKLKRREDGDIDLTPMIDVVFQLIIFFIVTIKLDQEYNEEITLEKAEHGPIIVNQKPLTLEVEVDKKGRIYIHGAYYSKEKFAKVIKNRYREHHEFPVLLRGDRGALHSHIKDVMDICTANGLWRIDFAAIQEQKRF